MNHFLNFNHCKKRIQKRCIPTNIWPFLFQQSFMILVYNHFLTYSRKIINQTKIESGSFLVNFRFQAKWKRSRTEPKILQLGSDSSLKYVRMDREKHVQISLLMEKACYHVQLPQRPSMDLQKKALRLPQLESLFPINIIRAKEPSLYYCLYIQRYF